jgi:hypothetical protein
MTPDKASLIAREKQAKQQYDRAIKAMAAQGAEGGPETARAELEEAKRNWEAARKRLEAFQAEGSSKA